MVAYVDMEKHILNPVVYNNFWSLSVLSIEFHLNLCTNHPENHAQMNIN